MSRCRTYMKDSVYGFKQCHPKHTGKVQYNKELYRMLMQDRNYTFVVPPKESNGVSVSRAHPYQHKFVAEVLADLFFFGKRSLGMKYWRSFKPVPLQFIALVYTIVCS